MPTLRSQHLFGGIKKTPDSAPPPARKKQRWRDDRVAAFCFLLPSGLGLIAFLLVPLAASLALSFTNVSLMGQGGWVGFHNYITLLTIDPSFWGCFGNTCVYTAEYLILNIAISLLMAVWISNLRWGRTFFRVLFFLPTFTPLVGSAIVWLLIFTPGGLLDWVFHALGLAIPNLMTSPHLALQAVIIVSLWSGFGYNLILFSAALDAVPTSYIDAADMDGSTPWQSFWFIKIPMISPSLFFGTVMTMITSFQVFDQVYALTHGGPGAATQTLGYNIYTTGFERYKLGYASSIAWVLFIIIMALTILQLKLQKRWVRYDV